MLIKLLIEDCIARGLDELDFTIGAEPFKYRFSNQERMVYRMLGFRSALAHTKFQLNSRLRGAARRLVRRGAPGTQSTT